MGISRDDRVSKTELLRRANMPCVKAPMMKPKLRGVGHVVRTDDARLPKMVFFSDLATGARSIRHPLKRFTHSRKQKTELNPILGNPHRKPQGPENGRPQGRSRLFKKGLYNLDQAFQKAGF